MILNIKVKTQAKEQKIINDKNNILVHLKSPAEKGKANKELIKALAKFYNCPQNSIKIIKGAKNKNKVIKI